MRRFFSRVQEKIRIQSKEVTRSVATRFHHNKHVDASPTSIVLDTWWNPRAHLMVSDLLSESATRGERESLQPIPSSELKFSEKEAVSMKGRMLLVASAMLIVNGYIQAQTPGRVPIFDQPGTGACNAAGGNDCVDSVITQDSSGNIGVGTTTPAAKLDVVGGNVNLQNSGPTAGNILKGGFPFLHNYGNFNTFLGLNAGNFTMTGVQNTAIGYWAFLNNTTGNLNTASGTTALYSNTTGSANTASGVNALFSNTTGDNNTASGFVALYNNTTGSGNTASGYGTLGSNTTGSGNTATGDVALYNNTTGSSNTATGPGALYGNTTGSNNTALGYLADVSQGDLTNATAIGANAVVNASNKIRLGDTNVSVIEGQVPFTFTSDRNQKENFQPVDGEQVLTKIGGLNLTSWNYIGHDPKQFRHYGPVAQEFFDAFGHDGVGTIGTETTINSGDMEGILMIAVQALGKQNAELKTRIEALERVIRSQQESAGQSAK